MCPQYTITLDDHTTISCLQRSPHIWQLDIKRPDGLPCESRLLDHLDANHAYHYFDSIVTQERERLQSLNDDTSLQQCRKACQAIANTTQYLTQLSQKLDELYSACLSA